MPIVSGGSGGGGAGTETLISTTTLGADGTFDVSGIAPSYNDLKLVMIVRGTRVATAEFLQLRLNNDSGAHYDSVWMDNAAATNNLGGTSARISSAMPAASSTAGLFGAFQVVIPGYAGAVNPKTGWFIAGAPTVLDVTVTVETGMILWNNTAAISRVAVFGGTTANLLAGSQLRIYGVT